MRFDSEAFYIRNVKWAQDVATTSARKVAIMFPSECRSKASSSSKPPTPRNLISALPSGEAQLTKYVEYIFV